VRAAFVISWPLIGAPKIVTIHGLQRSDEPETRASP